VLLTWSAAVGLGLLVVGRRKAMAPAVAAFPAPVLGALTPRAMSAPPDVRAIRTDLER
jgi:hypothetical protein